MEVKDLLEREDIRYIPKGADYVIRCLNPDHEDRNPSLRVDSVTGIFNCFSCQFKGNIFKYFGETPNIMQQRRIKLQQKIEEVRASSIGLELPTGAMPYEGDHRDISPETYKDFGAFTHHDSEFADRIWFPIYDMAGRTAVFQGRLLVPGTPKYLFYPRKTTVPLFMPGEPYQNTVIMVEGIYDMLRLWDNGLKNVCCPFGVNNVTKERGGLLKLRGVNKVFLFFDGDEAGQKGAQQARKVLEAAELIVSNICLDDQDPGGLSPKQVKGLTRKLYG